MTAIVNTLFFKTSVSSAITVGAISELRPLHLRKSSFGVSDEGDKNGSKQGCHH